MTVSYQAEVATYKHGRFIQLLLRWKASVYKLVWFDLSIMLLLYYALNSIYIYALDSDQKRVFEALVAYCQIANSLIPLSFVLGFFVSQIIMRWWKQCMSIPWPDPVAVFVSSLIKGQNESGRMVRRTIMRYVNLTITLTLRLISPLVKKRFSTYEKLMDVGLLTQRELVMFNYWDAKLPKVSNYWVPIVWACNIIVRAKKEGMIRDENGEQSLLLSVNSIRIDCLHLLQYDFMNIPLVYTQTVTLAFYAYFLGAVIGHQWTENMIFVSFPLQKYFPVLLVLQFLFYMGWIKVAEVLIAPFGEDDEDFELNWLIDRNIAVSYAIVDEMHQQHPELMKDAYWDSVYPDQLPYHGGVKKEEMPLTSTSRIDTKSRTGLLTLFNRHDQGTVSPASSYELEIHKQTYAPDKKIHFNTISSEPSRSSESKVLIHKIHHRRAGLKADNYLEEVEDIEEEELEDVSEEEDDNDDYQMSPFEQLKEERERLRNKRNTVKYIPVKVNKQPSPLKYSSLDSATRTTSVSSYVYSGESRITLEDLGSEEEEDQ